MLKNIAEILELSVALTTKMLRKKRFNISGNDSRVFIASDILGLKKTLKYAGLRIKYINFTIFPKMSCF